MIAIKLPARGSLETRHAVSRHYTSVIEVIQALHDWDFR